MAVGVLQSLANSQLEKEIETITSETDPVSHQTWVAHCCSFFASLPGKTTEECWSTVIVPGFLVTSYSLAEELKDDS